MSPTKGTPAVTLDSAIATLRERHDRKGHTPTNVVGYCAESDGISAGYCEDGVYLAALLATTARPQTEPLRDWQRDLLSDDADGRTLPQVVADLLGVKSIDLR